MRSNVSKLAVLALAMAVVGCAAPQHRTTHRAPVVTSRRADNLLEVASRHMACPVDAVEIEPLTEQVWQARGCGDTREFGITHTGRFAEWRPVTPANLQASNDLGCPADRIVMSAPSGGAREVSGCGRRALYQLACSDVQCEWVLTSQSGAWTGRGGVTVTPPPGHRLPAPRDPVVVVPEYGRDPYGGAEPAVARSIRQSLEARRSAILACVPGAQGLVLRAQWREDGLVLLSLDPPWSGTTAEQCVRRSVGTFQVTTGRPGSLTHLLR